MNETNNWAQEKKKANPIPVVVALLPMNEL